MAKLVIGLYDDFSDVNDAIRQILAQGYQREDISVIASDEDRRYSQYLPDSGIEDSSESNAAAEGTSVGAGIGAVVGGFAGLLAGFGAFVIPVVGPVLAAGPLAAAVSGLAGAGVGAVAGGITGGLVGALMDAGVPQQAANTYTEGIRRGGTLLAVRVEDAAASQVRDLLNQHHPVNISERSGEWQLTNTTANFPNRSFESGEALFRRHWTENGGAHTSTYEQYQPAYQFGYNLGINPANSGRTWADLESEAHDAWEMRRQGTWDQYHDAIVFGWQQAAGSLKD